MMIMKYGRALPLWFLSGSVLAGGDTPWVDIGWHTLNLAILFGVLFWFFGKKVTAAVSQRAADIQVAVDQANEARKAAQHRADELEKRLEGVEAQLAGIRKQAEAEAAQEAEVLFARAESDAAAIREAAERTIRDETARARQGLRAEAVSLATQLAGAQLKSKITPDDQKRLAGDFLTAVKSCERNEVANG